MVLRCFSEFGSKDFQLTELCGCFNRLGCLGVPVDWKFQ